MPMSCHSTSRALILAAILILSQYLLMGDLVEADDQVLLPKIQGEWMGTNSFGTEIVFTFVETNGIHGNCRTDLLSGRVESWDIINASMISNRIAGWLVNPLRTNATISVYFHGNVDGNKCRMRIETTDAAKDILLRRK
jgi:hypothetical protein